MRSKLIIGLAVFAFLLFFIPKVGAASGQLYQVDSEKLMVRASADPQGEIVAELQQGDLVTVFQNDFGWGRTFYNGQEAWVAVHHLVKLDEQESSDEQEAQVNNDERNSKENEKKRKTEKEPAEKN
ncbi:SH3 domain-containing protein [Virgibacillus sp. 179-BFC.A HS]|uniref:SH3 domain-containing protein n=1 Tax=Tigheibacillus jepli TaxID=3035914 RepID=A0ABU5CE41_9BACI|nr:SH3 domain-containing protein [Virgibacillus sp. 179-BFC.A HS]MDY0404084.1 SH3 domain-containing protein [Virgibacillus sp. 179-BFC.A HS]